MTPAQAFSNGLLQGTQPELLWWPDWLATAEADTLLTRLQAEVAWEQRSINFAGRTVPVPRLVAWYGDAAYRYGGFTHPAQPFPPLLDQLRQRLAAHTAVALPQCPGFNSVLLNYYRDGRDSMSFHADDERELGPAPVIASLSLGVARTFQFRSRAGAGSGRRRQRVAGTLTHGSLLVMYGRSQADWEHAIPKEDCAAGVRINLTFRWTAG